MEMKSRLVMALGSAQIAFIASGLALASGGLNLGFEEAFIGTSNLDPKLAGGGGQRRVLAPGEVLLPTNWIRKSNNLLMESYVLRDQDFTGPDFPTEGNHFLYLFSSNFSVNRFAGQYIEQSTILDLSQVASLEFDFGRTYSPSVDHLTQTYLMIDDVVMWSVNGPSALQNVQIDVSNVTSSKEVTFGLEYTQDHFGGPAGLSYFDNIVLTAVPEPSGVILFSIVAALYVCVQRGQPTAETANCFKPEGSSTHSSKTQLANSSWCVTPTAVRNS